MLTEDPNGVKIRRPRDSVLNSVSGGRTSLMKNIPPQIHTAVALHMQGEPPRPLAGENHGSEWESLAHELRQPLSVIESLAYYLELTSKDEGACVHLQQIQSMVRRANRILAEAVSH